MPTPLEYINNNSLPCKTWLNGTNPSNFVVTGGSFTWLNSLGNTNYDFLTTNLANFPNLVTKGVTFNSTSKLSPRNLNILSADDSYSIIVISEPLSTSNNQQLLTVGNTVNTLTNFIEYSQNNKSLSQQFSVKTLLGSLNTTNLTDTILSTQTANLFISSHYTKYGYSEFSTNGVTFQDSVVTTKGSIKSSTPRIILLGNKELTNLPYLNKVNHFLVFCPALSKSVAVELSNLLLDSMRNILWDNLSTTQWDIIGSIEWDTIL